MSRIQKVLDNINALCQQEESGYLKRDYLGDIMQCRFPLHHQHQSQYQETEAMDESCRASMVKWCNNLVDFCEYDKQTAEIAVSSLDRYVASDEGSSALHHSEQFQLVAMTAFYTAAKIHQRQALEPESIAKLSRGVHTTEAVEEMERHMLKVLQWRMNPPTTMTFVHLFLDLIPPHLLPNTRDVIEQMVEHQVCLALSNYALSLNRTSHIALAALLNVIFECQQNATLDNGKFLNLVQSQIGSLLHACTGDILFKIRYLLSREVESNTAASTTTVNRLASNSSTVVTKETETFPTTTPAYSTKQSHGTVDSQPLHESPRAVFNPCVVSP